MVILSYIYFMHLNYACRVVSVALKLPSGRISAHDSSGFACITPCGCLCTSHHNLLILLVTYCDSWFQNGLAMLWSDWVFNLVTSMRG